MRSRETEFHIFMRRTDTNKIVYCLMDNTVPGCLGDRYWNPTKLKLTKSAAKCWNENITNLIMTWNQNNLRRIISDCDVTLKVWEL